MKMDAPKPDPTLAAERQRSESERIASVQDRLAAKTSRYMRLFGTAGRRASLNGTRLTRPAIAGS